MTRHLNRINFVLLIVITGITLFQWNIERDARQHINSLQRTAAAHEQKIAEQDETIKGANEDLDRFRIQVTELKTQNDAQVVEIRDQKAKLFQLEELKTSQTKQIESLRQALDAFKAAVASRDENIKTLLEQREQLYAVNKNAVEKANLAINSYNDVNGKYADLVTRYNDLVAKTQAAAAKAPKDGEAK
jgi:chromosome segregation ATPase